MRAAMIASSGSSQPATPGIGEVARAGQCPCVSPPPLASDGLHHTHTALAARRLTLQLLLLLRFRHEPVSSVQPDESKRAERQRQVKAGFRWQDCEQARAAQSASISAGLSREKSCTTHPGRTPTRSFAEPSCSSRQRPKAAPPTRPEGLHRSKSPSPFLFRLVLAAVEDEERWRSRCWERQRAMTGLDASGGLSEMSCELWKQPNSA